MEGRKGAHLIRIRRLSSITREATGRKLPPDVMLASFLPGFGAKKV